MELAGKKILIILPRAGFDDLEFDDVTMVLTNYRAHLDIASLDGQPARTKKRVAVIPDLAVPDVEVSKYAAVVLIGCKEALTHLEKEPIYAILREARQNDILIGALCSAPIVLAKAGIAEGITMACHQTLMEDADNLGVTCSGEEVEVDNGIVTGEEDAAEAFAEEIADILKESP